MHYRTAYERWAGVGPYYAMFPLQFVNEVVQAYTEPGQGILDPFAGRASSIFAGASMGRPSLGVEIHPVGWIYGKTKLGPASREEVQRRLVEIADLAQTLPQEVDKDLPEFFTCCFAKRSLRFLLAARSTLDWQRNSVDRTLMTLILIDLHGGREKSFSNQMRQSKAMSPDYSIRWWAQHNSTPPDLDPRAFLEKKILWRYAKGTPTITQSDVFLADSQQLLNYVPVELKIQKPFTLLFTSPPYMGISDYHRDQWLRLWMLGGQPFAARHPDKHKRNFASITDYTALLQTVFQQTAEVMSSQRAIVYVRTDAREPTFTITRDALKLAFPHWQEKILEQPYSKQTQTALYGDKSTKVGEKDIILTRQRG
jgi:hypothetical protein